MALVDRKLVESFLRINHLNVRAPETELKTIFVEARWSDDEIKAALKICEEVAKEKKDEGEKEVVKSEKQNESGDDADTSEEKSTEDVDVHEDEKGEVEVRDEEKESKIEKEGEREESDKEEDKKKRNEESTDERKKKDVPPAPPIKKKQRKFWRSEYVGTDIVVDPQAFQISKVVRKREPRHIIRRTFVALGTMLLAVTVAAGVGLGLMWFFELGPFYTHADSLL